MRIKLTICFILTMVLAVGMVSGQASQDESPLPNPTSPIMDYAGVVDSAVLSSIEKKILDFRESSNPTVEIAVAVVKTTDGRPIFDYSLAVARGWKIGTTKKDNPGLLLLVAVDDRKYFTQVSRDLEDELTDGVVGSIQRKYLVPEFRKGNYSKGIADTIDAYIETVKAKQAGEPAPIEEETEEHPFIVDGLAQDLFDLFCCLGVIAIFIIIIVLASSGSGKGGGGGGRRRKRGESGFGEVAADIATGIAIGVLTGGGGGGSSSSSSDWGGGGGGFGGFGGGGSFGGGGAGGSW